MVEVADDHRNSARIEALIAIVVEVTGITDHTDHDAAIVGGDHRIDDRLIGEAHHREVDRGLRGVDHLDHRAHSVGVPPGILIAGARVVEHYLDGVAAGAREVVIRGDGVAADKKKGDHSATPASHAASKAASRSVSSALGAPKSLRTQRLPSTS